MYKSAFVVGCAVFCAVLAGMGILDASGRHAATPASVPAAASTAPSAEPVAATATVDTHITAIPKGGDGHYWVNALVNDKAVKFLVDTGATTVALTPADAQRLGFNAGNLVYDQKVTTANGQTLGAHVTLVTVGVGQSEVQNVDAIVIKDGLSTSLLGMSYLGRLSRIDVTPSSLILHP
ncbi:MAG TPA: TIGR02281 family clan AA aspartic protease [Asticcacaulis sp.]|nr:TIGR02281 family clan AA aspartic protease [Asticcacaulis sp.]